MIARQIKVSRQARYYLNAEPTADTEYLWIACHGYGQLAQYFIKNFEVLDPVRHLVVAPEAMNRFYLQSEKGRRVGAAWMTREDRHNEIADYVAYLNGVYEEVKALLNNRPLTKIAFGFSQGTATISRWAFQGNFDPEYLVLWAGDLPYDLDREKDLETLRKLNVWMALGNEDPYITPEKLAELEAQYRKMNFDWHMHTFAGKHTIPPKELQALVEKMVTI